MKNKLARFYIIMIFILAFCQFLGYLSNSEFNSLLFIIIACAVSVNLFKESK